MKGGSADNHNLSYPPALDWHGTKFEGVLKADGYTLLLHAFLHPDSNSHTARRMWIVWTMQPCRRHCIDRQQSASSVKAVLIGIALQKQCFKALDHEVSSGGGGYHSARCWILAQQPMDGLVISISTPHNSVCEWSPISSFGGQISGLMQLASTAFDVLSIPVMSLELERVVNCQTVDGLWLVGAKLLSLVGNFLCTNSLLFPVALISSSSFSSVVVVAI